MMSGGYFDYKQYQIEYIKDELERLISRIENHDINEPWYDYSVETVRKFNEALYVLGLAQIYVHRIDWLASGDDSQESFHTRLREDLDKYYDECTDRCLSGPKERSAKP